MQSLSTRVGAIISTIGAVLIFISYILFFAVYLRPVDTTDLWLLVPLILLSIGAFAYFKKLPRWLLIVYIVLSALGLLLQVFFYAGVQAFACFDVCNPTATAIRSSEVLLGLGGFLLNEIGAFVILRRTVR